MQTTIAWAKGHGTENDFVLLPDPDASVHGDLDPAFVAQVCDRRRGIGADGVLRVVRSSALGIAGPEWFMDYRNADGSVSEMCGNGVRVFAAYLVREGLADDAEPIPVGTRDGVKSVRVGRTATGEPEYAVDMGRPEVHGLTTVAVESRSWQARHVSTGNPHAVAFVGALGEAGTLDREPVFDHDVYPDGVNVEFVARRGDRHVAMRVHERGAGETRSCGTGAVAVAVATARADGDDPASSGPLTYRVDVPGGTVHVTWRPDGGAVLTGPAEIVAEGTLHWIGAAGEHDLARA